MKIMLRAADVLADLVEASRDGREIDEASYAAIASGRQGADACRRQVEEVEEVIDFQPTVIDFGLPEIAIEPTPVAHDRATNIASISAPRPELYAKANETVLVLRELNRLGAMQATCDTSALPLLDDIDPNGAYLSWTIELDVGARHRRRPRSLRIRRRRSRSRDRDATARRKFRRRHRGVAQPGLGERAG